MPIPPPSLGQVQRAPAELQVESDWIEFFEVAPGRVRIEVTVHNKGGSPSGPQQLRLHAAPIGAHLGWRPLTQLRLPALRPRRTLTVATEVYRAQPSQNSLPLQMLRGAAHVARRLDRIPNLGLLWNRACNEGVSTELWARSLPLDPFELLGQKSPNWVGAIRMRIGSETTMSRCRAQALRFAPGKENMVLFSVGTQPDEYSFEMKGKASAWNPRLLVAGKNAIEPLERVARLEGMAPVVLIFDAPSDMTKGDLKINVLRKSNRQRQTIEFDFDSQVPGPGCFLG